MAKGGSGVCNPKEADGSHLERINQDDVAFDGKTQLTRSPSLGIPDEFFGSTVCVSEIDQPGTQPVLAVVFYVFGQNVVALDTVTHVVTQIGVVPIFVAKIDHIWVMSVDHPETACNSWHTCHIVNQAIYSNISQAVLQPVEVSHLRD